MSTIDFRKIRPVRGSANNGFEELCCQLARVECVESRHRFLRNGTPDGGVEGYSILPSGEEHGWQAKYFFEVEQSQWAQIDDSVKTALEKHPKLTRYTVCLPIDLPDARVAGQRSLRQKWDERVKKWEGLAAAAEMSVTFEFWGEHEISSRLTLKSHAGRRWYWFNETELSETWFGNHLAEAIAGAGPRYNNAFNVDLPIARRFESLGHTTEFRQKLTAACVNLRGRLREVQVRLANVQAGAEVEVSKEILWRSGETLESCLDGYQDDVPEPDELEKLDRAMQGADGAANVTSRRLRAAGPDTPETGEDEGAGPPPRPYEYERDAIQKYRAAIHDLDEFLQDYSAELAGRPAMLLTGEAGSGKTHLLCDIASHRIESGLPTLVLLGQHFARGDVWGQVVQRLGLRCTRDELLDALESAAEAAGGRALIFLDAINEAPELDWLGELPAFLEVLSRHSRIGVAISCRTTYVKQLVRKDLVAGRLSRVEHEGFAPRLVEAISLFCRHYGIETLNTPPLDPEFGNPLFLKLFCQGLHNRGMTRPPRGHRGLQRIFSFLIDSVNEKLHFPAELDFPEDDRVVQRAVEKIADAMVESGGYAIPRPTAQAILDEILPRTQPGYSRSLLRSLVAEGIIADDLHYAEAAESPEPVVRFGYERLADYQIARRLLDRHVEVDNPGQAFVDDQFFGKVFEDERRAYKLRGLLSALIVLVPERTKRELAEFMPKLATWRAYREAFLEALPWREGGHFTPKSIEFIEQLLEEGDHGSASYSPSDEVWERVIQVAASPDHPLNARWLHSRLGALSMPERDLLWSTFLHRAWKGRARGVSGAVERLLDWAWPDDPDETNPVEGFDDEVVSLAAITAVWFLTTSNRPIRDRATKALVCLLHRRLHLVPSLLDEFRHVNDMYVAERLYCAVYGCVMLTRDIAGVQIVASCVHGLVFADGEPPAHLLLRDYARGVIECAVAMGCTFNFDLGSIAPPYRSEPPPRSAPAWNELQETYKGQGYSGLILSLWPGHGDFARYVMGSDSRGLHTWVAEPDPYAEVKKLDSGRIELPEGLAADWFRVKYGRRFRGIRIREVGTEDGEFSDVDLGSPWNPGDDGASGQLSRGHDREVELFLESLSPEDRRLLEQHEAAESIRESALGEAQERAERLHGDGDLPCRWIMTRVLEFGWTPERFATFDREVNWNDMRQAQKPERIGKKYQWIAYHELAARVTDHRPFQHEYYSESVQYQGPWQRYFRDIDPSFLVKIPPIEERPSCWWLPLEDPFRNVPNLKDQEWLLHTDSIPDFSASLSLSRPTNATRWLPMSGYGEWRDPGERGGKESDSRRVSFSLAAVLSRRSDLPGFLAAVSEGTWNGMDVSAPDLDREFLGEYSWAPSFQEFRDEAASELGGAGDENTRQRTWLDGVSSPVARAVMRYTHGSGFDCSMMETVSGFVPSTWMAVRMGLTWGRSRFDFIDRSGRVVAYDPSHHGPGPGSFLVERPALERMLTTQDLALVWLIIGEKMLLRARDDDPRDRDTPRVSVFRQIYVLDRDGLRREVRTLGLLGSPPTSY